MPLDLSMVRVGACPLLASVPTTRIGGLVSSVKVNFKFPRENSSTALVSMLMGDWALKPQWG